MRSGAGASVWCLMAWSALSLTGCASIQEHETLAQPLGRELQTYVGGTVLRIERTEDLPNAFGGRDIWGGKRPKGAVELKYLGLGEEGTIKLRVLSTDIETNENWRRRLGRQGYATTSTDSIDFEHEPARVFSMEGFDIEFLDAQPSSLAFRITRARTPQPQG